MEVTGGRRGGDKSEDSEDGGPPNGHGNGFPYGNGNAEGVYHNDSMQTDGPGDNGHSNGDREADEGRGGSQEQANDQDGRKTHRVHRRRPHPKFHASYAASAVPSSFKPGSHRFHVDSEGEQTEDGRSVSYRGHQGQKMYESSRFHSPFLFEDGSGSGVNVFAMACNPKPSRGRETTFWTKLTLNRFKSHSRHGKSQYRSAHGGNNDQDGSSSRSSASSRDKRRDNDHDDNDLMNNDAANSSNSSDDNENDESDSDSPTHASKPLPKSTAKSEQKPLICPFRRYKPYIFSCKSSYHEPRTLIHHIKQTHKLSFHSQCTRYFASEADLKRHNSGQVCCRKCRTGFGSMQEMAEHKGPNCEASKRGREDDWKLLYQQSCGDGLENVHNCYAGEEDYEEGTRRMMQLHEEEIRSMRLEKEMIDKSGTKSKRWVTKRTNAATTMQKGKGIVPRGTTPRVIQGSEDEELEYSDRASDSQFESEGSDEFSEFIDYSHGNPETLSVFSNDVERAALREENSVLRQRVHFLEDQARASDQVLDDLQGQVRADASTISGLKVENQRLRERATNLQNKLLQATTTGDLTGIHGQVPPQSSSQPVNYSYGQFGGQMQPQSYDGFGYTFPPAGATSTGPGYGFNPMQQQIPEPQPQYRQSQSQPQLGMINTPMMSQQPMPDLNVTPAPDADIDLSFIAPNPNKRSLFGAPGDFDFNFDFLSTRPRKRSAYGGVRSMFSEDVHDRADDFGALDNMDLGTGSVYGFSSLETSTVAGGERFDNHYGYQGGNMDLDGVSATNNHQWNHNPAMGAVGPGPSTARTRAGNTTRGRRRQMRPTGSVRHPSMASRGTNTLTTISQNQSLNAPTLVSGPTASSLGSESGLPTAGAPDFPFFSQTSATSNTEFAGTPTPQVSFDEFEAPSYARYEMAAVEEDDYQILLADSPMRGGSVTPTLKQSNLATRMQSHATLRGMPSPIVGVGEIFKHSQDQASSGGAFGQDLDEMLARFEREG
jgi:hypothetical protein